MNVCIQKNGGIVENKMSLWQINVLTLKIVQPLLIKFKFSRVFIIKSIYIDN